MMVKPLAMNDGPDSPLCRMRDMKSYREIDFALLSTLIL